MTTAGAYRLLGLAALLASTALCAKVFDGIRDRAAHAEEQGTAGKETNGPAGRPVVKVRATADFDVSGDGKNAAWSQAEWVTVPKRTEAGHSGSSRIKVLYSSSGLYVLFEGEDKRLTTTGRKDFDNLWEEDVFEVFLWPDEKQPVYFEYEISPLANELPILVPNFGGTFFGWLPWHYSGARKTRKATTAQGGAKEAGAAVAGWTAEIFFPYSLLHPLQNIPPKPGTRWRGNFYRMDYDDGKEARWTWAPVGESFHEYEKFGTLLFE